MKLLPSIGAFSLVFFSVNAIAQTVSSSTIYEGKIGNSNFTMHLDKNVTPEGKIIYGGEYFYNSQRKLINLIPIEAANPNKYYEVPYNCYDLEDKCKPKATIEIDNINSPQKGFFTNLVTNAQTPISFGFVRNVQKNNKPALEFKNNEYFAGGDIFYSKLTSSGFEYSKEKQMGVFATKMAFDKFTKVSMPIITRHPNKNAMNAANAWLQDLHYNSVLSALECYSYDTGEYGGGGTFGSEEETKNEIKYITKNMFVLNSAGSTYCGGAHPNNFIYNNIWDFTLNQEMDLSKYFDLFQPKQKNEDAKYNAKYRKLVSRLKPKSKYLINGTIIDKETIEECFSDDYPVEYSLSFNAKGMVFSISDVPHVMGGCMGDYYVIPYKELVPYMTKQGKSFFAEQLK